jgi:hypothetical protein
MRCPNDSSELIVIERQGIEIQTCPVCRGVWLERGDLDEIINRSIPGEVSTSEPQARRRGVFDRIEDAVEDRFDGDRRRRRDKYSDDGYGRDDDHDRRKKRKGKRDVLEDLLDF